MKAHKASISAKMICAYREVESMKQKEDRVCDDSYAALFCIGYNVTGKKWIPDKKMALWVLERILPGLHNSVVARVRYFDDYLEDSLRRGLDQLVLLGAGYDTRAFRFPQLYKQGVNVFEVDHPATQQAKKSEIEKFAEKLPAVKVRYVPVDFQRDSLGQQLKEHGYQSEAKTLFIWEGVTMYITEDAVNETLQFIANNSGKGSSIIFDYLLLSAVQGKSSLIEAKRLQWLAARHGEPFTFVINPEQIESLMIQRGFREVVNVNGDDYKGMYFDDKPQRGYVSSLLSFVSATV